MAAKDKFLTPQNQRWLIFGVFYILTQRAFHLHCGINRLWHKRDTNSQDITYPKVYRLPTLSDDYVTV